MRCPHAWHRLYMQKPPSHGKRLQAQCFPLFHHSLKDRGALLPERRNALMHGIPNNFQVHLAISVRKNIPCRLDAPPGNIRVCGHQTIRQLSHKLANLQNTHGAGVLIDKIAFLQRIGITKARNRLCGLVTVFQYLFKHEPVFIARHTKEPHLWRCPLKTSCP